MLLVLALLAPLTIDGLSATPPGDWKSETPTSSMRKAQFSIGDAELAIFFFGEGQGGDAEANVERWKTLFENAKPPKVTNFKVKDVKVTYFDISGTYLFKARPVDPNLTAEKRPNHRMLAVVWESPHGPYFMRFVGPEKTVSKHKAAFDAWLKSFK